MTPDSDYVAVTVVLKNGVTARRMIDLIALDQAWDRGAYVREILDSALDEARQWKLPPCPV